MVDFVPASIATTAVAPLGTSVRGTIETNGDHDWYRVNLVAGVTYQFRLHGNGRTELNDTLLTLRSGTGTVITSNDDSGTARWGGTNNLDSFIEFTATTTGVHFLDVGGFSSNIGDFLLTAVVRDASLDEVYTIDEIAWQLTNNFNEFNGAPQAVAFNVGADGAITVNITALTAAGQTLARAALLQWTALTGITFAETGGAAEITFDDNAAGTTAFANWVSDGVNTITSATVQVTTGWLAQFGTGFNSYSYETYIHEIGHALGLGHGGNYNGSATFGVDNHYRNDSLVYSIMSYMQAIGDEFGGPNTTLPADFRFMLTPAVADVVAIQLLYGASANTRTGNTTYVYNSNTGNAALDAAATIGSNMFLTIQDNGGTDTIDLSGSSVANIVELRSEVASNVLGGVMNLWIARNVVIENVIGGSANDIFAGNSANNVFNGMGGSDTVNYYFMTTQVIIDLGAGVGVGTGVGNDTYISIENAVGGSGNDIFSGTAAVNRLDGGAGIDTMSYYLVAGNVIIDLAGNTGVDGTSTDTLLNIENANGGHGNDQMSGRQGIANVLNGLDNGAAGDTISYYLDNASVTIELNLNRSVQGGVVDTLLNFENANGSSVADIIRGTSGNNVLNGLGGGDTLTGNGGNDTFVFARLQASGDSITDFVGNGAGVGDTLRFTGYGTAAQGSTFTFVSGNTWQIHSGLHGTNEFITINGGAGAVHATDFVFV